jgi:hypothetical protein
VERPQNHESHPTSEAGLAGVRDAAGWPRVNVSPLSRSCVLLDRGVHSEGCARYQRDVVVTLDNGALGCLCTYAVSSRHPVRWLPASRKDEDASVAGR